MNKDEKLKELEERQRALADEIRALREDKKEEFVRGRFYKVEKPKTVVVVATGDNWTSKKTFSGINIANVGAYQFVNNDGWIRERFTEVIPKWLTPWELKNPEGIDSSKPEHDTDEIPDWWLCECWDNRCGVGKDIRFFDAGNKRPFWRDGRENNQKYDHYRMIPAQEWPEWARDAWRNK